MALPIDITDPGTVNAGDQGFGAGLPVQVPTGIDVPASVAVTNVHPGNGNLRSHRPLSVDQAVSVGTPSTNSGNLVAGGDLKPGLGVATVTNDPGCTNAEENPKIGLGLPLEADGDASRPGRTPTEVTANNVANQVFGTANGGGLTRNVFV